MSKTDIVHGHTSLKEFVDFMNERHLIYLKRKGGDPWPWTDDPILRDYKFTNVFRELDHGTIVLRQCLNRAIEEEALMEDILFTLISYRMFNWHENLTDVGFVADFEHFKSVMYERHADDKKVFTSCHMTSGRPGEDKIDTYMDVLEEIWSGRRELLADLRKCKTLQEGFGVLRKLTFVGPFVAYEMVSDLRWTPILNSATDKLTWANIGPGAKRGLQRLGMDVGLESLQYLYRQCFYDVDEHLAKHYPEIAGVIRSTHQVWPPFEMREIEHCLCEFDKYQRAKTGVGRPREKYRPENARILA